MTDEPRTYWSRVEGQRLIVATTKGQCCGDVFTVTLPLYDFSQGSLRPWHFPVVGLQVAHGVLVHHLSLFREEGEARTFAAEWRERFSQTFLAQHYTRDLELWDDLIDRWLLNAMLEDRMIQRATVQRACCPTPQPN